MVLYYFDIHPAIFYFKDRLVIPLSCETAVVLLATQNLKTELLGYGYVSGIKQTFGATEVCEKYF